MNKQQETPAQYEARKIAFLKMKTRRITNALRKQEQSKQAKESKRSEMTAQQRIDEMNIAHAEWVLGC